MVLASEQEEAELLCTESMALFQKELGKNEPIASCEINSRSIQYWNCVLAKQKAGNKFVFSTAQCESVDPQ